MHSRFATATALSLALAGFAWAQAGDVMETMQVGDPAPPIDIEHWVLASVDEKARRVHEVTELGKGKVYVLEFWATWCGPCRAGMPHLSELAESYREKGVTVIGVSDEALPTVVEFLASTDENTGKLWREKIHYTLCTDPDESVKNDYFRAAGRRGIPSAFIVGKDGHVEWIGHPMQMDEPLDQVVAGTWDRDAFREEYARAQKAERARRETQMALRSAIQAQDWEDAVGVIEEHLGIHPDDLAMLQQKFNILLIHMNEPARAYELGSTILAAAWDDANTLNSVAWTVVDDEGVKKRNLDFAMKAAVRANELTESKNAAILDTLARVFYEQGDLAQAIEWQQRAVEHAGADRMGDSIREVLRKYEKEHERENEEF